MNREPYGHTRDGQAVERFTMRNKNGIEVSCINYGCRITNMLTPAHSGQMGDIVLGYDTLAEYEADATFQGAFIGRYANRIRSAEFTLKDVCYKVEKNEGENYLHGGFHAKVFEAEIVGENSISFTYTSPNGEEDFPGELWVAVMYTLTDDNELVMSYRAKSTENTVVNFTNHSYFNLSGGASETIEGHKLWLGCSHYIAVDEALCPVGEPEEVFGTPFDFSKPRLISQCVNKDYPQLKIAGGYDHCFVMGQTRKAALTKAATLEDEQSGRVLDVYTTEPGIQVYTGNGLKGEKGKGGKPMLRRGAVCLETEHFPSSPTMPEYPSTLLRAGDKFTSMTVLRFGIAEAAE